METVERLAKLARQYRQGVLGEEDLTAEMLEVVLEDRRQIVDASLSGKLVTA